MHTSTAKHLIKPRALKSGDTVGIVAPASPVFERSDLQIAAQWLSKLGLKYKLGNHIFDSYSDYAGSDSARAEDLHRMWGDPEVKAILPIRGGSGCVRILPELDFDLIEANPKIFIGYSDITGLLIPIHQKTGLVTFHGPVANSFNTTTYTFNYFRKLLMQSSPVGFVTDPQVSETGKPERPPTRVVINAGRGQGRLVGGCMTLIRQLMGTPYEINTRGRILFLEDVNEEPHAVDRMLSQLDLAGKFEECSGIIIGQCQDCQPGESGRRRLNLNYSLETMLKERLGKLGIPVVYGLRIGHSDEMMTLPLGVIATLHATADTVRLKLEESATV